MVDLQRRYFFPVVLFILAYEWLVSGLDKVISGTFVSNFHHQLQATLSGPVHYEFYQSLLQLIVLPNSVLFAWLVECGELVVGATFVVLGVMVVKRQSDRRIRTLGILTGLLSAFMTLNFFFYQGGSFFLSTSNPFDEGIPVTLLMVFIQLAVAGRFWTPRRRAREGVEMRVYTGGRGRHMA